MSCKNDLGDQLNEPTKIKMGKNEESFCGTHSIIREFSMGCIIIKKMGTKVSYIWVIVYVVTRMNLKLFFSFVVFINFKKKFYLILFEWFVFFLSPILPKNQFISSWSVVISLFSGIKNIKMACRIYISDPASGRKIKKNENINTQSEKDSGISSDMGCDF